jgi:phosphate/sulfate permease
VELLLFASVIFYAYTIGVKDNFKGVATLFGRSVSDYRKAILWFNMRRS